MDLPENQPHQMDLPEEILMEILAKLPVKSLLRFRSVCKTWKAMIRSPYFGDKHLLNHCHKSHHSSAVFLRRRRFVRQQSGGYNNAYQDQILTHHSHRYEDYDSLRVVSPDLDLPYESCLNVYGSCNGILCFSERHGGLVYLLNPSTRESLTLPSGSFTDKIYFIAALGFGFDPTNNDYKVIRIARICNRANSKAEIYKLSTNSWTKLDVELISISFFNHFVQVFVNCSSHWLVSTEEFRHRILTFDFHTETFEQMSTPVLKPRQLSFPTLAVLGNSLALIVQENLNAYKYGVFDVWVMMEYGNKDSWTKKYSVAPLPGIDNAVLTCWNGQNLLIRSSDGYLVLFALDIAKETGNFDIQWDSVEAVINQETLEAVIYQETLVSLSRRS